MNRCVWALAAIFLFNTILSQELADSALYSKTFVKLTNGEVHIGSRLTQDLHFFSPRIVLDDQRYKFRKVAFYNSGGTLYGNFQGSFTPLVLRKGNINFFEGRYEMSSNGKRSAVMTYYYSKGLVKVKRLKTRNLVRDLRGDSIVTQTIKSAQKYSIISWSCLLGSYGLVMGTALSGMDPNPVYYVIPVGGIVYGVVCQFIRKRKTQHALIRYAPELPLYQPKFFTKKQRRAAEAASIGT